MLRKVFILLILFIGATSEMFGQSNEYEGQSIPNASMAIEENEYYFGEIAQGDTIVHDFEIKNTGVTPLIIYGANPSCPCLTVTWPTDTIMPNGTGIIHSVYDSKTKIGPQVKQITVSANTEEQGVMYVRGEVLLPNDSTLINYDKEAEMWQLAESDVRWGKIQDSLQEISTWEYRMAHSNEYQNAIIVSFIKNGLNSNGYSPPLTALAFISSNFSFGKVKQGEIIKHSFAYTNTGENPLYILSVQANPNTFKISYPQEAILPGLCGKISVEFDTSNVKGKMKEQIVVSTNSLPVESIITIQGKVYGYK